MMQQHRNQDRAALDLPSAETVTGVIQNIDIVQRELSIRSGSRRLLVDVPPECDVTLRGEPIKLRLMQPGDVIRIHLIQRSRSIAQRIEVAPGDSLPAASEN